MNLILKYRIVTMALLGAFLGILGLGCSRSHDIAKLTKEGKNDELRRLFSEDPNLVNKLNEEGKSAIFYARAGSMVDFLVENGADVNLIGRIGANCDSPTYPVHEIAASGNCEVLDRLLYHGASVEQSAWDNTTPLMLAVTNGKLEAANLLMDRGANPEATNSNGRTVLDCTRTTGHHDYTYEYGDGERRERMRIIEKLIRLKIAECHAKSGK